MFIAKPLFVRRPAFHTGTLEYLDLLTREAYGAIRSSKTDFTHEESLWLANAILLANSNLVRKIQSSETTASADLLHAIRNYAKRTILRSVPRGIFAGTVLHDNSKFQTSTRVSAHIGGELATSVIQVLEDTLLKRGTLKVGLNQFLRRSESRIDYLPSLKAIGPDYGKWITRKLDEYELQIVRILESSNVALNTETIIAKIGEFSDQHSAGLARLVQQSVICPAYRFDVDEPDFCLWLLNVLQSSGEHEIAKNVEIIRHKLKASLENIGIVLVQGSELVADSLDIVADLAKDIESAIGLHGKATNRVETLGTPELSSSAEKREASAVSIDVNFGHCDKLANSQQLKVIEKCISNYFRGFYHKHPIYEFFCGALYDRYGENIIELREAAYFLGTTEINTSQQNNKITDQLRSYLDDKYLTFNHSTPFLDLTEFCESRTARSTSESVAGTAHIKLPNLDKPMSQDSPNAEIVGMLLGTGTEFFSRLAANNILSEDLAKTTNFAAIPKNTTPLDVLYHPNIQERDICLRPRFSGKRVYLNGSGLQFESSNIVASKLLVRISESGLSILDPVSHEVLAPQLRTAHDWTYLDHPTPYLLLGAIAQRHAVSISLPEQYKLGYFTPELRISNCVVRPATCQITAAQANWLRGKSKNEFSRNLENIKSVFYLPSNFSVGTGDKRFSFSRDQLIKSKDFEEFCELASSNNSTIERTYPELGLNEFEGKTYKNCETAIAFFNEDKAAEILTSSNINLENAYNYAKKPARVLGKVLYFKLYGMPDRLTEALVGSMRSFFQTLIDKKVIDRWFSLKFSDPKYHLRLRLFVSDTEKIGFLLKILGDYFDEFVGNEQFDSWSLLAYQPEIYRYGGTKAISLAERWFWICTVQSIQATEEHIRFDIFDDDHLVHFSARSIVQTLNSFKFSKSQSIEVLKNHISGLRVQFGTAPDLLVRARSAKWPEGYDADSSISIINLNDEKFKEIGEHYCAMEEQNELTSDLNSIVLSICHLSMVRLLKKWRRDWELVAYTLALNHFHKTQSD